MADYEYRASTNGWEHPETGVVIWDEDMPDELLPACTTPGCPGDYRYAAPGRGHQAGCTHPHAT